jgi:hypothetical protein
MLPTARREHIVTENLGEELAVYDEERDRAYCLGKTAALIWRRCDGETSIGELATMVQQQLGLTEPAEALVLLALEELREANLLIGPMPHPSDLAGISGHGAMVKLAAVGVVPLLQPAAASVVAQLPALALLKNESDQPAEVLEQAS